MKRIFTFTIIMIALTACTARQVQTPEPAATDIPRVNMPNPASVYCKEQGNKHEIRIAADGSQNGICVFRDGSECDEWAYYRGECSPTPPIVGSVVVSTQTITAPTWSVIPQSVPMPAGAIIDPRDDRAELTKSMIFYNTDGITLGELLTPLGGNVHVAGKSKILPFRLQVVAQHCAQVLQVGERIELAGDEVELAAGHQDPESLRNALLGSRRREFRPSLR